MDHQKIVVNYVGGACPQHFRYVFDIFGVFRLIVHWVHTPSPPPKKKARRPAPATPGRQPVHAQARDPEAPGSRGTRVK